MKTLVCFPLEVLLIKRITRICDGNLRPIFSLSERKITFFQYSLILGINW